MRLLVNCILCLSFLIQDCMFANKNDKIYFSAEQTAVLREFFYELMEESEMGYVIYNQKPLCIYGYREKENFAIQSSLHKQSVALKEGLRIWNNIYKNVNATNFYLHCNSQEDPLVPGCRHILIFNVPLFHKVVNENLPLFQMVLGPSMSSQDLLDALIVRNMPIHTLLKNNSVLIGVLLGFGTQNSLFGGRLENINNCLSDIKAPFLKDKEAICIKKQIQSLCYNSPLEEYAEIQKKIIISSDKLINQKPIYIFAYVKGDIENICFVNELEKTQDLIREDLTSSNFLKSTISKFIESDFFLSSDEFKFSFNNIDVHLILSTAIWDSLQDYDSDCLDYFLNGLMNSNPPHVQSIAQAWDPNYRYEILNAKFNLKKAEKHFDKLEKNNAYSCLIPKKLFSRKISDGNNIVRKNKKLVNLTYSLYAPKGHCFAFDHNVLINLNDTIVGFYLGVNDMSVGETREFWIHPELSYGYDTPLEKGIHIKAIITLNECIEFDNNFSFEDDLKLNNNSLSFLSDARFEERITNYYTAALYEKGLELRNLLAKDNAVQIPQIITLVRKFQTREIQPDEVNKEQRNLINQFLWNLYFRDSNQTKK